MPGTVPLPTMQHCATGTSPVVIAMAVTMVTVAVAVTGDGITVNIVDAENGGHFSRTAVQEITDVTVRDKMTH